MSLFIKYSFEIIYIIHMCEYVLINLLINNVVCQF